MLKTRYEKEESKLIVYHLYQNNEWRNVQNDIKYALNGCDNNINKYQ